MACAVARRQPKQLPETPYGAGVAIENVDGLNAAIANWIVERKSYWHGRELRFLRKRLNLSQKALADLLGYSDQQVRRWEKDASEMPSPASRLLRLLACEWETKADAGRRSSCGRRLTTPWKRMP